MPELPEVEVNRRGLENLVQGKTIEDIQVYWDKMWLPSQEGLTKPFDMVIGQTIRAVDRRGKYLIFRLDEGDIVSHLRMEGKYFYYEAHDLPEHKDKHTHIIFFFTDRTQLHYNDVRKFGRMEFIEAGYLNDYFSAKKLGPEPNRHDFKLTNFLEGLQKTQRMLKPALLSQKYVVGLGNIYVDEVLFQAQIHPQRLANQLSFEEYQRLYEAILQVLQAAVVAGGSTIRSYRNTVGDSGHYQEQLKVYGRQGSACPRCGQLIEKIKVAQRGTHICSQCQRLE